MRNRLLHPATVIATIALLVALSGTGWAVTQLPRNSVGTPQLKRNAVTSAKVRNGSLLAEDFKSGQLPQGAKGDPGPAGPQGAAGSARAYASIAANGAINAARSRNVTSVTVESEGYYCVRFDASVDVATTVPIVSPDYGANPTFLNSSTTSGVEAKYGTGSCAGGIEVLSYERYNNISNVSVTAAANQGFFLMLP